MENTTPKQYSWEEFRKEVFTRAMNLVENCNCSNFKVMGYKYLDMRVILYFHDCNQVFDYSLVHGELVVEMFYTANKTHDDRMTEADKWNDESDRDVPEAIAYKTHVKSGYIITAEDALKLLDAELGNMAPGEVSDPREDEEFLKYSTGKTLREFVEWRWPEEPQKQFEIALKNLAN